MGSYEVNKFNKTVKDSVLQMTNISNSRIILLHIAAFDYLRLLAALLVMFGHGLKLMGSNSQDWLQIITYGKLDMAALSVDFFFFLSGFLMYGALARSQNMLQFMINRIARILPGLIVCVFVTILAGAWLTSMPMYEYFSNIQTWRYLKNVVFLFNTKLPGLFNNLPYPSVVNGSLWTLGYEMGCYILVSSMSWFFTCTRVFVFANISVLCIIWLATYDYVSPTMLGNIARLLYFFSLGHVFAADKWGKSLVALIILITFASVLFVGQIPSNNLHGHIFAAAICAILIYYSIKLNHLIKPISFDYSYGFYIYAFPLQQWLVGKALTQSPVTFFLLSVVFVLPFATISWYLVERPGMLLIKKLFEEFKVKYVT